MNPVARALKRSIDVAVAAAGLAIAAPFLAIVAAAIRADSPGPVFFRQRRLGLGGQPFLIWKFRTMHRDAGVVIDGGGNVVNSSDDARHTRMGRVLRALSIDEIPQLINVLAGEMSLVGPRPDLPDALGMYTEEERSKLTVKPGITGPAQATGRNALSAHEKWALDARYARDASLRDDLRIIWSTIQTVAARRGVYSGGNSGDRG